VDRTLAAAQAHTFSSADDLSVGDSLAAGCAKLEFHFRACNFGKPKLHFQAQKGGEDRAFSIPLPTVLMPLLDKLKSEKRSYTLEFPFQPSP
jgi:hypothetical protein